MKILINIISSILLSISLLLVLLLFTLFNSNYIIHILDKYNYYEVIKNNIENELLEIDSNLEYEIDIKDIKTDVDNYIKSYYKDSNYINKIKINNVDIIPSNISDIYNKNIKFINIKDVRFKKDILLLITFIIVIITGNIFNKYKNIHDNNLILVLSGIINILIYGILYIFINIDSDIINKLFIGFIHYYLGISIIMIEYVIYKKYVLKR